MTANRRNTPGLRAAMDDYLSVQEARARRRPLVHRIMLTVLAGVWPPAGKDSPPPPCDCGHPDSKHLGLTGPCLAAGTVGELWADTCKRYRPKR